MTLNYKIEETNLTVALNEIEKFEEKMALFIDKYPHYSYSLDFSKNDDLERKWVIDLKIERYEQQHT